VRAYWTEQDPGEPLAGLIGSLKARAGPFHPVADA